MEPTKPTGRLTPPPGSVMDDRLLSREFYNANVFKITFLRLDEHLEYIKISGINPGPPVIECEPEKHVWLPHGLYAATWPDYDRRPPEEVIFHMNMGEEMFKGIKPNRETIRKARRYVR